MARKAKKGYTLVELTCTIGLVSALGIVGYCVYKGIQASDEYISSPTFKVERANVIEGDLAEKFIDFNGERYYAEVDGQRVENIVKK